jgi:ABC-type transport system substrate-binding protein
MMDLRRLASRLVGALAGLALGAGAALADQHLLYGESDPEAKPGGALMFGSLVEPPALDPYHQAADARLRISVLMYQGLMYEAGDGIAQPLLAESYEASEDGLTTPSGCARASSSTTGRR